MRTTLDYETFATMLEYLDPNTQDLLQIELGQHKGAVTCNYVEVTLDTKGCLDAHSAPAPGKAENCYDTLIADFPQSTQADSWRLVCLLEMLANMTPEDTALRAQYELALDRYRETSE